MVISGSGQPSKLVCLVVVSQLVGPPPARRIISLTTVETHRTHILQKLGLHSVPELILYAVRKRVIS